MSEATMRRTVLLALRSLDAVAVENRAWPGTPDVNYVEGWIELKQVSRWPARGGELKLSHFTKEQRLFLKTRWDAGGNAFLLLKVRREWLLFDGDIAALAVGHRNQSDLERLARKHWPKGLNEQELIQCLSR